tara:strand:- start:6 stop:521 length:516 start_codon:yes stop_codon:yes gene_type:complete
MSIYKLTCAETGKNYYGSTGNDIKRRKGSGWYKCACKDFVNAKLEVLEYIEDKEERLKKENYYITNFDCVNIDRAIGLTQKEYNKLSYIKNGERQKEPNKEYRKKIVEEKKHYCSLCENAFQSPKKLTRHIEGYRHKLKQESFDKYGDSWKEHYLEDNKKKYNEKRKMKNK